MGMVLTGLRRSHQRWGNRLSQSPETKPIWTSLFARARQMLGASSTRKLGHNLPQFPYTLPTHCGVRSACCFLRNPTMASFSLTQHLIHNLMISPWCHPEKIIISVWETNLQEAGNLSPTSDRGFAPSCCSAPSAGRLIPALPLVGCRRSSQRVFNTPWICLMGGAERIRESWSRLAFPLAVSTSSFLTGN